MNNKNNHLEEMLINLYYFNRSLCRPNIYMLRALLESKNMSAYKLEKSSHISHATLMDLYNEKTNIEKCSSSLLHKLAASLNMKMDDLYKVLTYEDLSLFTCNKNFDLYKSFLLQELNELKDNAFLKKYLTNNEVEDNFKNKKYECSLYLLSLIDYLCIRNNLPLVKNYECIREYKLDKIVVPESVFILFSYKKAKVSQIYKECIPIFKQHNIIEAKIDDVA